MTGGYMDFKKKIKKIIILYFIYSTTKYTDSKQRLVT